LDDDEDFAESESILRAAVDNIVDDQPVESSNFGGLPRGLGHPVA